MGKPRQATTVLQGRVRDVVDSGESVVETELGVVFVRGGLPGEHVRVRAEQARQGVRRGTLLDVLSPSESRVEPVCPVVDRCGGCPLMRLALPAQRTLKAERVRRALATAGLATPELEIAMEAAGDGLAYRRRARLVFRRLAQRTLVGYRQAAGHTIVDIEGCPVLDAALQTALRIVLTQLAPNLEGSGEIELASDEYGAVVATITAENPVGAPVYRSAEALATQSPLRGVALRVAGGAAAVFGDMGMRGHAPGGEPILTPASGFSQSNAVVNRRLAELVVELAEPAGARVLELYAGHGNFTVALAANAAALWAVESHPAAANACRENLARRGLHGAKVIQQDVAGLVLREKVDVLVLDPPRGGAKPLAELVVRTQATRVVYVSCHMTTLARDLGALAQLGFRADHACALDMFPQTAHVEAVVRLRRTP